MYKALTADRFRAESVQARLRLLATARDAHRWMRGAVGWWRLALQTKSLVEPDDTNSLFPIGISSCDTYQAIQCEEGNRRRDLIGKILQLRADFSQDLTRYY